jgi:hypothetical protein
MVYGVLHVPEELTKEPLTQVAELWTTITTKNYEPDVTSVRALKAFVC